MRQDVIKMLKELVLRAEGSDDFEANFSFRTHGKSRLEVELDISRNQFKEPVCKMRYGLKDYGGGLSLRSVREVIGKIVAETPKDS